MPTYFKSDRFIRDYASLSEEAKARFRIAVVKFVDDLRRGDRVRPSLGVRQLRSAPGVFEFHFDGDGRATFEYGKEQLPGETHIVWRRIGSHAVYSDP